MQRTLFGASPTRDVRLKTEKPDTMLAEKISHRVLNDIPSLRAGCIQEQAKGTAILPLMQEDREGDATRGVISNGRFMKLGGLQGDRLTRVPRGFDKAHQAAPYLMHKQFMAFREEPGAFATSKDFYKNLLGTFKTLAPLVGFLNEPLIGRQSTAPQAHIFDE